MQFMQAIHSTTCCGVHFYAKATIQHFMEMLLHGLFNLYYFYYFEYRHNTLTYDVMLY